MDQRLGAPEHERWDERAPGRPTTDVLDLLRHALGVDADDGRSNGLHELAGTWSDVELAD